MRIEIQCPTSLRERMVFVFITFDFIAVFVGFRIEHKPKRTWITLTSWDKYDERGSSCKEPILSHDIKEAVKLKMIEFIKVKTWGEWKKD